MLKEYKTPLSGKSVFIGPDSKDDIYILALESSCDETACAIVKNGRTVLSNIVASQIKTHQQFGGVVPEIAAREHLDSVIVVINQALEEANMKPEDITAVAATVGPGLVGSLLVGLNAAKAFAVTHDKPFIGVNHLNAHVCANYIDTDLKPPMLALLVSGGHTQIIKVDSFLHQEIIGETIDDATGEVYDKVARLMGLPYPGGVNLDKLAQVGNPKAYILPKAKLQGEFDFSFSGLKTAVLNLTKKLTQDGSPLPKEDVAASFQECITSTLYGKTLKAAQKYGIKQIVLGGGVAANSEIRKKFFALKDSGYKIYAPAMKYCTDNASMIASCAYFYTNTMDSLEVEVFSRC